MVLSSWSCLISLEMLTRKRNLFEETEKIKERNPFYRSFLGISRHRFLTCFRRGTMTIYLGYICLAVLDIGFWFRGSDYESTEKVIIMREYDHIGQFIVGGSGGWKSLREDQLESRVVVTYVCPTKYRKCLTCFSPFAHEINLARCFSAMFICYRSGPGSLSTHRWLSLVIGLALIKKLADERKNTLVFPEQWKYQKWASNDLPWPHVHVQGSV